MVEWFDKFFGESGHITLHFQEDKEEIPSGSSPKNTTVDMDLIKNWVTANFDFELEKCQNRTCVRTPGDNTGLGASGAV